MTPRWARIGGTASLAAFTIVVLVSVERVLEAEGLEYAFEDCAVAAVTAAVVVAAVDLRS